MGVGAAESAFYPRDSRDGGRGLFQITAPPKVAVALVEKRLGVKSLDPLNQRHNAYRRRGDAAALPGRDARRSLPRSAGLQHRPAQRRAAVDHDSSTARATSSPSSRTCSTCRATIRSACCPPRSPIACGAPRASCRATRTATTPGGCRASAFPACSRRRWRHARDTRATAAADRPDLGSHARQRLRCTVSSCAAAAGSGGRRWRADAAVAAVRSVDAGCRSWCAVGVVAAALPGNRPRTAGRPSASRRCKATDRRHVGTERGGRHLRAYWRPSVLHEAREYVPFGAAAAALLLLHRPSNLPWARLRSDTP